MGITQFVSMRNPKIILPTNAPVRPKVNDSAAAITLKYNEKRYQICRLIINPTKKWFIDDLLYNDLPFINRTHLKLVGKRSTITV